MALFKLPLAGDVVQWINPVTSFFNGSSFNVYLGESSAPKVEADILDEVGTYGRQLGQICDAVVVLSKHLPHRDSLPEPERKALDALEAMAHKIADIKTRHGRAALRP